MFIQTAWAAAENSEETGGFFTSFLGDFWMWMVAILLFLSSFAIASVVTRFIINRTRKSRKIDMHEEVVLLLDRSIYFGIVVVITVISFNIIGLDLTWVLGAMSFGLGFAFKDILANFIGGMVILSQHKFKIGDLVKIGETFGRIISIDVRTTEIQEFDGTHKIIPNADMVTDTVQNFTYNETRRISFEVGVHFSTPLDQALKITEQAVKSHPSVIVEPAPMIICKEFGDSAIKLDVRFWIESNDKWWVIQSDIIQLVKKAYDQSGIVIPFPIRTMALDAHDKNLKTALHLPQ